MSELTLSDLYWGTWIFVLFLIPEILAACGVIGLYTLSHTTWLNEDNYPWLRDIISGFLIGLAVHLRWGTKFGPSELGGIAIVLIADLVLRLR